MTTKSSRALGTTSTLKARVPLVPSSPLCPCKSSHTGGSLLPTTRTGHTLNTSCALLATAWAHWSGNALWPCDSRHGGTCVPLRPCSPLHPRSALSPSTGEPPKPCGTLGALSTDCACSPLGTLCTSRPFWAGHPSCACRPLDPRPCVALGANRTPEASMPLRAGHTATSCWGSR